MKNLSFLTLLAAATFAHAAPPKAPIFEERFNTPEIEYINGAVLGAPGSGVSGSPADRAYVATPANLKNEPNGPAGIATTPITPNPLSAFTCTFWYYLDEDGPELQVPLCTGGAVFSLSPSNFEVRVNYQVEQPRSYNFPLGLNGPRTGWLSRKRWIFAAVSWDQITNTLMVYQGTPEDAVVFMRDMKRPAPGKPTLPQTDMAKNPDIIGNNPRKLDRPLAGRIDDLRLFDRVLPIADLETIRRCDVTDEVLKLE